MNDQFNPKTGARGISWTDYTHNVIGGCKHGCRWEMPDGDIAVCYAETTAQRFPASNAYKEGFDHHYWRPHMLQQPRRIKEPSFIFADSMADLMGGWVPDEEIEASFQMAREADWHIFQWLTKNAPRMLKFNGRIPPNAWMGVSSPPDFMHGKRLPRQAQLRMLQRQIDVMRELDAPVKFMSIEPLSWDIAPHIDDCGLDWAIIGAASNGPRYYQPKTEHVVKLLDTLDSQGIPVFFKGNLKECPASSPWREDFPVVEPLGPLHRRQQMAMEYGWTLNSMLHDEPDLWLVAQPVQAGLFG